MLKFKNSRWLILSALVVILDLWSKHVALAKLVFEGNSVTVLPVFNWTLAYNHGAAFSFLAGAGGWQRWLFTGLAVVAIVVFTVWILRLPKKAGVLATALALVLGGAIGNLIDRTRLGYVIDFIQVHWQQHYFPVFNLADSAITLGAILLIIDMLFLEKKRTTTISGKM